MATVVPLLTYDIARNLARDKQEPVKNGYGLLSNLHGTPFVLILYLPLRPVAKEGRLMASIVRNCLKCNQRLVITKPTQDRYKKYNKDERELYFVPLAARTSQSGP